MTDLSGTSWSVQMYQTFMSLQTWNTSYTLNLIIDPPIQIEKLKERRRSTSHTHLTRHRTTLPIAWFLRSVWSFPTSDSSKVPWRGSKALQQLMALEESYQYLGRSLARSQQSTQGSSVLHLNPRTGRKKDACRLSIYEYQMYQYHNTTNILLLFLIFLSPIPVLLDIFLT